MKRALYSVVDALEAESFLSDYFLLNSNVISLNRENWSTRPNELPTRLIKSPINVHYGLDSDPLFIHVVKTLEDDLIKREGGIYFYELSDYIRDFFIKEGLFSQFHSSEFGFHEHFYGFSDILCFYQNEMLKGVLSSTSGEVILNLTLEEKSALESKNVLLETES